MQIILLEIEEVTFSFTDTTIRNSALFKIEMT